MQNIIASERRKVAECACVMLHDRNLVQAYLDTQNITVCAARDRTACADDEVSSLAPLVHKCSYVLKAALVSLGPKAVKRVRMLQCSPSEWADTHIATNN